MQMRAIHIYNALRLLATPLRREWTLLVFGYAVFAASRIIEEPSATATPAWIFWAEEAADLYIICAIVCALPRRLRPWARALVYAAIYAAAIAECFVKERFHLLFGPITIQLVSETNPGEAGEFFAAYLKGKALGLICAVFVPLAALNICAAIFRRRIAAFASRTLPLAARRALCCIAPLAFIACIALTAGEKVKMAKFFAAPDTDTAEHQDLHAFHTPLYRIAYSMKFLMLSRKELAVVREGMRSIRIDSCAATIPNIVLYIGESYNKHHSQLYGYFLPTTPRQQAMARAGELIAFRDAVTPWNVTSNVFKDALSTHSTDQRGSWVDGVLLPGVLKAAGYRVAFITSQFYKSPNLGAVDFNGSFFLNDREIERRCFDHRNKYRKNYDLSLLREIDNFAAGERNFVIFHGMGQHQEYSKRYGKDDVKFTAGNYPSRHDLSIFEKQIIADYDNATLYNDSVVAALCGRYRRKDAVVVYMPDHGEEVFDRLHSYGRDHNAEISPEIAWAEFEVPFEIWFSPTARRLHADLYDRARRAASLPFSTDDLPHLIMGLAGISSPLYNAQRDPLSTQFRPGRKRILKRSVDYDSLMSLPRLPQGK